MKRLHVLLLTMAVLLASLPAQAQQRSPNSQGDERSFDLFQLILALEQQRSGAAQLQRGGGGLGPADSEVESDLRELERFINRSGGPVMVNVVGGAWWTNPTLVSRLGLTEDQKDKILKSFESHRLSLESSKALLEKEEVQLARLLGVESVDRNAALAQIYRVVNARGEMERTNATMTLEMRGHLTLPQWTQLQAESNTTLRIVPPGARGGAPTPTPAPALTPGQRGGTGARGQRQ